MTPVKDNSASYLDPVSNIRQVVIHVPKNATPLQLKYFKALQETQDWHHQYWTQHNRKFVKVNETSLSLIFHSISESV